MSEAKTTDDVGGCVEGPDVNATRSPVDKKLYRQIMLSNGLKVILICDTAAMQQEMIPVDATNDDDAAADVDSKDGASKDEAEEEDKQDSDADEEASGGEDGDDDDSKDSGEAGDNEEDGLRDAAAAMVVGVGSMYDPPEAQGLAHFLEHMLFMGTKKYPEENAYDAFLSKHGGSDNAFTEMEYTLYHLCIQQEKLFPALDMFAQFFIEPLMSKGAVEREMNAVESEFQEVRNSDQCRLQQLMIHTSGRKPEDDKTHPFGKFSWGNLKSLRDAPAEKKVDIMNVLRSFYNQYYFASNMALVVMGAYPLDKLQQEVVKMFSDIPSEPREKQVWPMVYNDVRTWKQTFESPMAKNSLPLTPDSLMKVYRMPPVRDRHTLTLTWQIPEQIRYWRSRPCDYISHLLGHESEGSVLAALKKKAWATECYVGVGEEGIEFASSHALFTATFALSEEGTKHWEDVVTETFAYIGMLRYYCATSQLPGWIFEELRLMHDMTYRFGDEHSPVTCVEQLAERLSPHFRLPPDRTLDGHDLLFEHDENVVKEILDKYLTPSNARVDILSSSFGRAADFDAEADPKEDEDKDAEADTEGGEEKYTVDESEEKEDQDDAKKAVDMFGAPSSEPIFGTSYWVNSIDASSIEKWNQASQPQLPSDDFKIKLPPKNPFVPEKLELKPLPPDDADHPLLNASLKLCIADEKEESWFPATVTKYDTEKNSLLLAYEGEEEQWHVIDQSVPELSPEVLVPGYEGTLDAKKIKFRLVAVAKDGEGAVIKFGDETDHAVEEGSSFPAIPPPQQPSRLPQLCYNQNGIKMWHLQDRKFKRPIAELRTRFICENSNKSPVHSMCSDLFVNLVADSITETAYLASVSDLGSSYSGSDLGITCRVHGFDDKLLKLYKTIVETLLSFRGRSKSDGLPPCIRPGRFEALVEVMKRRYANSGLKASKLSTSIRVQCLRPGSYSSHVKAQALEALTEGTFVTTIADMMKTMAVETLYHGNVTLVDAKEASDLLVDLVNNRGLSKENYPAEPVTQIPPGVKPYVITAPSKDPTAPNTSVEVYFQLGMDTIEERVMSDLLTHIMYEPLYKQLRTEDQFGYTVGCDSRWTDGIMGVYFYVVSSSKSATEITERIERFLGEYRKDLAEMSAETFMDHVVGLAKSKLDMFNSLGEECGCYWSEIRDFRYNWQVHREEALTLRGVTKDKALKCYDKWIYPWKHDETNTESVPNPLRRSLIVQVIGTNTGQASEGRPEVVDGVPVGEQIDGLIRTFQESVGNKTWGKVY